MYLIELKEKYPLIYERVVQQSTMKLRDTHAVSGVIVWGKTTEGNAFWSAVNNRNWDEAMTLQPHLFEKPNEFVEVTRNGLFKQVENV